MDTVDLKLAQDCEALAVSASEGVTWLKVAADESPTVAQQAPSLISELQKVRNQSRKLARAARRRMCVGVFGPSQAGKSYLVSILASRDGRPMQARFGDKSYDFLREINPPGNRESTGLVTRFGLGLSAGDKEFPVRVRLLTQTDIVKILGNSFLLDFDHQKAAFERPDGAAIRKRLAELRAKAAAQPYGDLDSDDVLDLIEYFDTFFAGVTAELRTDYWREAIDLAPRLSGHDRARLWSVLWYDFQPFTDLYLTLYDGLQKLSFSPEALLGMDALIPREKSIVDVLTLDRLGADDADTLLVRPKQADGRAAARCRAAAFADLRADRRAFRRHRREAVGLLRSHRPSRLPGRALAIEARQPGRRRQGQGRRRRRQPAARAAAARQGRLSLPALLGRARALGHPALHPRRQPGGPRPLRHDDRRGSTRRSAPRRPTAPSRRTRCSWC